MARISKDHIGQWFDYGVSLETRTIYLVGEIDQESAERTVKGLHLLAAANANPITVLINSDGGDWAHGMAIYDYMRSLPNHVAAKVLGQAMSMATVILQAADQRLAYPETTIMVHHGTDSFPEGQAIDYERWAANGRHARLRMCDIYAERSGKPAAYWNRKCQHDYILTPQQALGEGLIDSIIEVPA
jgi:ATP-dependent Clp protease protease subunit